MQTLVIYDSKFGNTEKVARAIARGIGAVSDVQVTSTDKAPALINMLTSRADLVLIGGPTQNHRASAGLRAFLERFPDTLRGVRAACFDTRYRGPALLMGSAADSAAKRLAKSGAELVAAPESFFIGRHGPMQLQTLEPGEIERAEKWGSHIASAAAARSTPAPA